MFRLYIFAKSLVLSHAFLLILQTLKKEKQK